MGSPARVRGQVDRLVFQNPETGYYVLSLNKLQWKVGGLDASGRALQTVNVRGIFSGIRPVWGQVLLVEGDLDAHPKYGLQIALSCVEEIIEDNDGMIRYLARTFTGIGQVKAHQLVEHFGDDLALVIESDPDRLVASYILSVDEARVLSGEWRELRATRAAAVFLYKLGLGDRLVQKALAKISDVEASVRKNPYCLTSIPGVGFIKADRAAMRLGISADAPLRIQAAILHVLTAACEGGGHVFLPIASLVREVVAFSTSGQVPPFGAGESAVARQVVEARNAGLLAIEGTGADARVYPHDLWTAETSVPELLARHCHPASRRLLHGSEPPDENCLSLDSPLDMPPMLDVAGFIADQEAAMGVQFSPDQRLALETIATQNLVVITGLPGTGKTTIIRAAVRLMETTGRAVQLLAPTGIAAKRMSQLSPGASGSTIHRALGWRGGADFACNAGCVLSCDAAIVDEFSMVDIRLTRRLLLALRPTASVILVGDPGQLPPVGPGNVLGDLIASGVVPVVELKTIFRQSERSGVVLAAHAIHSGFVPDFADPSIGKDCSIRPLTDDREIQEFVTGFSARLDEDHRIFQVLAPMHEGEAGVKRLNALVRERLNPPDPLKTGIALGTKDFRVGDRVMFTRNEYELGVFNGDAGIIASIQTPKNQGGVQIQEGLVVVRMAGEDRLVDTPFSYVVEDLIHSYVLTVHKSQGQEYEYVIIVLTRAHTRMLVRNLLYTAVTRARKRVIIVGDPTCVEKAVRNDEVRLRNTRLVERLRAALPLYNRE